MSNDITIVSSTDSEAEVQAALTGTPVPEPVVPTPEAKAAADKAVADKVAADAAAAVAAKPGETAPPADETPAQKLEREKLSSRERRQNRIQSEIDKLTAAKHQAKREADAEEARRDALKAEAAALEVTKKAAAVPAPETVAAAAVAPKLDDVDVDGKPKHATYEDWVNASAVFHAERAAERVAAKKATETETKLEKKQTDADRARIVHDAAVREEQDALALYNDRLETFRSSTPDFDATYEAGKEFVLELVEEHGPDVMNVMDRFTTRDADNGPALMHHLLKNPEDMRRIAALPVPQQIAALARLDARLEPASTSTAQPPAAPVTRAPEPMKPVGSTPTASTVSPEDEDYRVYRDRRNREEREARGLVAR